MTCLCKWWTALRTGVKSVKFISQPDGRVLNELFKKNCDHVKCVPNNRRVLDGRVMMQSGLVLHLLMAFI